MKILITICARGGSKGIPGKNIKILAGKPLIDYSIKTAHDFKQHYPQTDIALSTDSDEISKVASECGLTTNYKRPESLAGDSVGKIATIKHIVGFYEEQNNVKYDFVIDLDVTSPLRNFEDLNTAFNTLKKDSTALNVFSVSEAARNPYFNMVEQKDSGYYGLVKEGSSLTRQSAPKVYDMNASFYIYTKAFFDLNIKAAITQKSLIYNVPHLCFDLDHPIDFEVMDYLISNNKIDFTL